MRSWTPSLRSITLPLNTVLHGHSISIICQKDNSHRKTYNHLQDAFQQNLSIRFTFSACSASGNVYERKLLGEKWCLGAPVSLNRYNLFLGLLDFWSTLYVLSTTQFALCFLCTRVTFFWIRINLRKTLYSGFVLPSKYTRHLVENINYNMNSTI